MAQEEVLLSSSVTSEVVKAHAAGSASALRCFLCFLPCSGVYESHRRKMENRLMAASWQIPCDPLIPCFSPSEVITVQDSWNYEGETHSRSTQRWLIAENSLAGKASWKKAWSASLVRVFGDTNGKVLQVGYDCRENPEFVCVCTMSLSLSPLSLLCLNWQKVQMLKKPLTSSRSSVKQRSLLNSDHLYLSKRTCKCLSLRKYVLHSLVEDK